MVPLAAAAALVLAGLALGQWRGLRRSERFLAERPDGPGRGAGFFIVVPMLMEQSRCAETLRYYVEAVGHDPRVRLILAVTSRERRLREQAAESVGELVAAAARGERASRLVKRFGDRFTLPEITQATAAHGGGLAADGRRKGALPTTEDLLGPLVADANRRLGREFAEVVRSGAEGDRARQVNLGIRRALELHRAPDEARTAYAGVFDCDSRPDLAVLDEIDSPSGAVPRAMQQPTLYLAGLDRFDRSWRGAVMVADALMQTHWCLSYELPNWQRAERVLRDPGASRLRRRPVYATGHGEWLRLDLAAELEGVPEGVRADGMFLGYVLSSRREPLSPLRSVDLSEVPDYPAQLVGQHRHWFGGAVGVCRLLSPPPALRQHVAGSSAERILLVAKESWINMRWLLGPWVVLAALAGLSVSLLRTPWPGALPAVAAASALVAAALLHSVRPGLLLWRRWDWLERLAGRSLPRPAISLPKLTLALAARAVLRGVGPVWYLGGWLAGRQAHVKVAR